MSLEATIIAGLSLAFSSTAFALQLMKDRGELSTDYGRRAFAILLFQDLAVIPLLAAIPFIAGAGGGEGAGWAAAARAAGVIAALVLIGIYVLDRIFRMVAGSGSREAFAATALFVVALTALAVSWAGLSMALGAFLAGALLAESSYKHQIQTDIEPFRGLLLGLFFISIGMRLDLSVIAASWAIVLGGAAGLISLKFAILYFLTRAVRADHANALKTAAVLSQGGEFAFVVISLGADALLFTSGEATLMSAVVTISMTATPLLVMLAHRLAAAPESAEGLRKPEAKRDHVIVAGFGRVGQIVGQVLGNSGVLLTAIDRNSAHIRNAERFGYKVYYGDASRLDVLETAGVADSRAIIFCMDDTIGIIRAVTALRERFPNLPILVCAHDRMHEIALQLLGPNVIVRETLESSILMAREALAILGHDQRTIDDYVQQFRQRDRERLLAQRDEGPEAGLDLLHARYVRRQEPTESS
jgi:Kef-type K+ transport system membrane component KefB/Trk K+ transport system NAD-binding subunit